VNEIILLGHIWQTLISFFSSSWIYIFVFWPVFNGIYFFSKVAN